MVAVVRFEDVEAAVEEAGWRSACVVIVRRERRESGG